MTGEPIRGGEKGEVLSEGEESRTSNTGKVASIDGRWMPAKTILTPILVSILTTSLTLFLIQPLATLYWQSPELEILGAQPVHLYEDENPALPTSHQNKMFNHRLAIILKVKNPSSSTPALINTALIEGCIALHDPMIGEPSLPPNQQMDFNGKPWNEFAKRHEHTVQSIRVSGIFQQSDVPAIPVGSRATEYVGILFPTSSGPYFIAPGSASLTGECSQITTHNKWPEISQLLENARPRGAFPKSLRKEFLNGQLKVFLFAANSQIAVVPGQFKPLMSVRWDNWPNLLLPQMFENPQDTFPPIKKARS